MSPTHTRLGAAGASCPSKRLGAARTAGSGGARYERAGLPGPQATDFQHPADAPAAYGVAFGT